jgi:hypothetical protein
MSRLHDFFLFLGANSSKPTTILILTIILLTRIDRIEEMLLRSNYCAVSQQNTKGRFAKVALRKLFPSACSWCCIGVQSTSCFGDRYYLWYLGDFVIPYPHPDVAARLPDVHSRLPDVHSRLPDVHSRLLDDHSRLPDVLPAYRMCLPERIFLLPNDYLCYRLPNEFRMSIWIIRYPWRLHL